jgi:sugar phosphate isomerase/epimerase
MKGKISVGTSAFALGAYTKSPVPFEKIVHRLSELGYDGLELAAIPGYGALETWPDGARRKKLTGILRAAGLGISAYGADLSPSPFYSNDPAVRSGARRLFASCLDFCADCAIPTIRVDTLAEPPAPAGVTREDAWKRAVETFRDHAEAAQRRGVVVAWEFEPGFMFNKPSEVLAMLEEVGHPNFTVMFDFCHANMVAAVGARQPSPRETLPGGAVEILSKLHGKLGSVHLIDSDNTLHDNMTSTHAPFGSGVLDMEALMKGVRAAGYNGPWWTIDLCFWARAWEELERSLAVVQGLVARHAG